jgi:hypothetical protein
MKRRDRIVVAIANLVLRAASKRYRDLTKALIVRGMEAERERLYPGRHV